MAAHEVGNRRSVPAQEFGDLSLYDALLREIYGYNTSGPNMGDETAAAADVVDAAYGNGSSKHPSRRLI